MVFEILPEIRTFGPIPSKLFLCVTLIVTRRSSSEAQYRMCDPLPPNTGCANSKVMLGGLFMQHSQGHHQLRHQHFSLPNNKRWKPLPSQH